MATWTTDNPHETTAIGNGGRFLWIRAGSPNLYVYSNGNYLGSETTMAEAKKRAEKGESKVDGPMSTEQEFRELKPRPSKLTWTVAGKDTWTAQIEGEKLPARVRQLDKQTFACYRDSAYLGSEETIELAHMRISIGKRSDTNRVMRLWEKLHPDELPPYLQMTPEERVEYWKRNPPVARRAAVIAARAADPAEDPKTRRMRESLVQDGSAGAKGRAKLARATGDSLPEGVIRVAGGAVNPKKAGTGAHARWELLFGHDGKTVKEYAEAKGNLTTLENAVKMGKVKVETE